MSSRSCKLTCSHCVHFEDDPEHLEHLWEGINIVSSTYGTTRGNSGICAVKETFHYPRPAEWCEDFELRPDVSHG